MDIKIRTVKPEDLDLVTAVEAECFPAAEAAGRADFERRIKTVLFPFTSTFRTTSFFSIINKTSQLLIIHLKCIVIIMVNNK